MILSDADIADYIQHGLIGLTPFDKDRIQPASIDVLLGPQYRDQKLELECLDLADLPENHTDLQDLSPEGLLLEPGGFILGSTAEVLRLPDDIVGRVEGKSSLGRLGLVVHSTAGYLDPGFEGTVTLEIGNIGRVPLVLHAGMPVAQLAFHTMLSPAHKTYERTGRYQGQRGPTESRYRFSTPQSLSSVH